MQQTHRSGWQKLPLLHIFHGGTTDDIFRGADERSMQARHGLQS
jgi:hypothetical protein